MKTIILLLLSTSMYAQYSFYLPKQTVHYYSDPSFAENEGGDVGLIFTYNNGNLALSAGVLRNSYGVNSLVCMIGLEKSLKGFKIGLDVGLSSGYDLLFDKRVFTEQLLDKITPKLLKDNGIIPLALVHVKIPLYKNSGLQVNISPAYINTGFYVGFGK